MQDVAMVTAATDTNGNGNSAGISSTVAINRFRQNPNVNTTSAHSVNTSHSAATVIPHTLPPPHLLTAPSSPYDPSVLNISSGCGLSINTLSAHRRCSLLAASPAAPPTTFHNPGLYGRAGRYPSFTCAYPTCGDRMYTSPKKLYMVGRDGWLKHPCAFHASPHVCMMPYTGR